MSALSGSNGAVVKERGCLYATMGCLALITALGIAITLFMACVWSKIEVLPPLQATTHAETDSP